MVGLPDTPGHSWGPVSPLRIAPPVVADVLVHQVCGMMLTATLVRYARSCTVGPTPGTTIEEN